MVANENSGERKSKRVKERERERGGSGKPSSLPRSSSFFPCSPDADRTDPLTEGLEQATFSCEPETFLSLKKNKAKTLEVFIVSPRI